MIRTADALAQITARLKDAGIEEPRREARLLLAAALGTSAGGLLARDEVDETAYEPLLARRVAREPLAYITGHREFWGLDFLVSPATLIPRPDTETLIEAVLDSGLQPRTVLDLGTGTGCLLLATLHEFRAAFGVGVDLNPEAAALARRNAEHLGLGTRAVFLAGSWADALDTKFDLVLSNPPYIESADIPELMPEVAGYEPGRALDGGADGLDAYKAIIAVLPQILSENGMAVLELGAGQAPSVTLLSEAAGFTCATKQDLAGIERAALLRFRK
ncbi:peptide chain release factor N(5)-glutamine methyltransferase [Acidocella aromatica]|uniref:Release factor glutamine methyltransferase n=1 Tax=Acidocella aromatica TaxID=1303579 RepID=A0A840VN74_9PROT|nr:peptide chain release factor N(5)-glutamine methyltransferase [Acidocella aromatica]MBB5371792.1 release factor glutamine methyltransferase [Acidocella aromatica]